ncbi:hybrid sensor histidine kinase/response regulator [Pseudobacteriovorax antillogorgiicola]|uniref:histidine kinase n=1 Tax=Pseudobacteriovorax antillogorgiicola TaxID=1513793 RepID=A0A1Y6BE58_9BACT|nr:hybrid sensor histidine kinase/response regulator [Pseudobacteriovorax antillogorgiicola]TCS56352.1 histidine kinase/DNA gyrase B/HSP90-like ATPase [Pseudobacteriovorax antillogorgiicola]SMF06734.1 Histidine kinase-, DNA gyrase B-, and HSP90-like ATPase [Pseudobacteriovorax antillogorgiicola]
MKILIIDDDPEDRRILRHCLQESEASARVTEAANLKDGVSTALRENPDCIFLDHRFPGETSGIEIFRELRKANLFCPIIATSGDSGMSSRQRYIQEGAIEFVLKDMISPESLPIILHNAIDKAEIARKLRIQQEINQKFTNQLTHDIRSPLINIRSLAELILESETPKREDVEAIRDMARNTIVMFENILKMVRDSGKITLDLNTERDIASFLESEANAFASQANRKGIHYKFAIEKPEGLIAFDSATLAIVIHNLISNAMKFTPVDGQISLVGRPDEGRYTIEVSDTGCGIPSNKISELFNKGSNISTQGLRGEKGYGLGLPFAFDIIKAHDSNLQVTSSPDGSRFFFSLNYLKKARNSQAA